MSTYCISDIHGHKEEFDAILSQIDFSDQDELYILGDIIDKGPSSAEMLLWATQAPSNVHFLLGNHEEMARLVLKRNPKDLRCLHRDDTWQYNYGLDTINQLEANTSPEWRKDILIPWLYNLPIYHHINVDDKEYMLVHAGFNPCRYDVPDTRVSHIFDDWNIDYEAYNKLEDIGYGFGEQYVQDMIWIKQAWITSDMKAPIETVCGHVYAKHDLVEFLKHAGRNVSGGAGKVMHLENKHYIDCGCAYSMLTQDSIDKYNLGCLRLDDMKAFYVPVKHYKPPVYY